MKIWGVYKIQSIKYPERVYIGSAVDVKGRWTTHLRNLRDNKHHSSKLQHHYNKYGKDDLEFSIIESGEYINKNHLLSREQGWFIPFQHKDTEIPFFNYCKTAGSILGIKRSDATCKKVSIGNKGKKRTPEQNEANRQRNLGRKQSQETIAKRVSKLIGKECSQEKRDKIGSKNRGRVFSEESRKKMGESKRGTHNSEETNRKISEANKGRVVTAETIAKIVAKHKGSKRSKEACENIRRGNIGRVTSEETKKKQRLAHLGKKYKKSGKPCPRLGVRMSQEARDNMSKAKKGTKHSEETIKRQSEAITLWWAKRKKNKIAC